MKVKIYHMCSLMHEYNMNAVIPLPRIGEEICLPDFKRLKVIVVQYKFPIKNTKDGLEVHIDCKTS